MKWGHGKVRVSDSVFKKKVRRTAGIHWLIVNHLWELRLLDKFPISDDHLRMKIKQQEVTEMLSRSELITIFKTSACLVTAPTSQFTFKCILTAKILKQGKKKKSWSMCLDFGSVACYWDLKTCFLIQKTTKQQSAAGQVASSPESYQIWTQFLFHFC